LLMSLVESLRLTLMGEHSHVLRPRAWNGGTLG
jgi:hypothetical protein